MVFACRDTDGEFRVMDPDIYERDKESIFLQRELLFNKMACKLRIWDNDFWSHHEIAIVPSEREFAEENSIEEKFEEKGLFRRIVDYFWKK